MNPLRTIKYISVGFVRMLIGLPYSTYSFAAFFIILVGFLIGKIISGLGRIPIIGLPFYCVELVWKKTFYHPYRALIRLLDHRQSSDVSRAYIIKLGYKNLMARKTRSFVTVFGMSVGIGVIILLLSLGYGIERLVISRIAGLSELRVIDVALGDNTSKRLDAQTYQLIKKIKNVESTIPISSLVGRISFNKATTDVLVYATSRAYLNLTNIKLKKGTLYASNLLDAPIYQVSGASTTMDEGQFGTPVTGKRLHFDIIPSETVLAYRDCVLQGQVMGHVVRMQGGYVGELYWGASYDGASDLKTAYDKNTFTLLRPWVKAEMPLYEASSSGELVPLMDAHGKMQQSTVCIPQKYTQKLEEYAFADVLGEATGEAVLSAENTASASADTTTATSFEVVNMASGSSTLELVQATGSESASIKKKQKILTFKDTPSGTAVISSALLNLLNISESKAIGTTFKVSFIITKSLLPELDGKAFTEEKDYKIIGIIDDPGKQYFYIPFGDMQQLGVKNFSQLKVVVKDKSQLALVRKAIEVQGFKTSSTVDTVAQIESLFNNLRILLVLLGMVALGVASLGMFNTLTVSLLERTREIGGMKTMGMVSSEVQDLFLSEAMIMGLSGGFGGVFLGYAAGKALSVLVSLVAFSRGQGYIDLAYVPAYLVVVIIVFSFVVGLLTGIYPSLRAKRISALNALRYE